MCRYLFNKLLSGTLIQDIQSEHMHVSIILRACKTIPARIHSFVTQYADLSDIYIYIQMPKLVEYTSSKICTVVC